MRSRKLYIATKILTIALLFLCNVPKVSSQKDIGPNSIIIDCIPQVGNTPINEGDVLYLVENIDITDSVAFYSDSLLVLNSESKTDIESNASFSFIKLRLKQEACSMVFSINKSEIDSVNNALRILSLTANPIEITYNNGMVCRENYSIAPSFSQYDSLSDFTFSSSQDIVLDPNGIIYPSQSIPGTHTIEIESEFCLINNEIQVTIGGPENTVADLEVDLCPNEDLLTKLNAMEGVFFYDTLNLNAPFDSIEQEEVYNIVQTDDFGCKANSKLVINKVVPETIQMQTEQLCRKTILFPSKQYNWTSETKSNFQLSENGFEFTQDTDANLQMVDDNGCISNKSFEIKVHDFVVNQLTYSVQESSCWEFGKLELKGINNQSIDKGSWEVNLENTINGKTLNINPKEAKLVEGIYKVIVKDSLNCEAIYPEKITVMQECLDNYPVFSPLGNPLGANGEESYFIPYEGQVKIHNRIGQLTKTLDTPAYWDGTDMNNNPVPMGNYILVTDQGKVVNLTIVR